MVQQLHFHDYEEGIMKILNYEKCYMGFKADKEANHDSNSILATYT